MDLPQDLPHAVVLPHLVAFYGRVLPKFKKLAPKILASHSGREGELFLALAAKYGKAAVDELIADIRASTAAAAPSDSGAALHGTPPDSAVADLADLQGQLGAAIARAAAAATVTAAHDVVLQRLRSFYVAEAPKFSKLASKILSSYRGREAELFLQLGVKYSKEVVDAMVGDVLRLLHELAMGGEQRAVDDAAQAEAEQVAAVARTAGGAAAVASARAEDQVARARVAEQKAAEADADAEAATLPPTLAIKTAPSPAEAAAEQRHDAPVWRRLRKMSAAGVSDAGTGTTVLVAVRVRPLNKRERALGAGTAVEVKNIGSGAAVGAAVGGGELGGQVILSGSTDRSKAGSYSFNFDFCLDSSSPSGGGGGRQHVSQARLFDEVGTLLLANAWTGFNVCLFAYGQTGSGKSFTMNGARGSDSDDDDGSGGQQVAALHPEAGMIPRLCHALFQMIAATQRRDERRWRQWCARQGGGTPAAAAAAAGEGDAASDSEGAEELEGGEAPLRSAFLVEASYLEIYSERVRDLLNPNFAPANDASSGSGSSGQLRVREHPKTGVFVEGLTREPVQSFAEIEELMEDGMSARAIAATAMNETSSRSHCIFTLYVSRKDTQRRQEDGADPDAGVGEGSLVTSKINLIDLAGSEDQRTTGAQGQRLKEGAQINKSLSSLGLCIAALARQAQGAACEGGDGGGKKLKRGQSSAHVPFRDSVLTWLLKESLGGNSKTVMLATVSPSHACLKESLSTLRYAERAKKVRLNATVNKTEASAQVAELRAQVAALQAEAALLRKQAQDALRSGDLAAISKAENVASAIAATGAKIVAFDFSSAGHDAMQKRMAQSQQKRRATLAAAMGNPLRVLPRRRESIDVIDVTRCHLVLLSDDPDQCGLVKYSVEQGKTFVGSESQVASDEAAHIRLAGLAIAPRHVVIERVDTEHVLVATAQRTRLTLRVGARDAATFLNGRPLLYNEDENFDTELSDGDRIVFGASRHVYQVSIREPGAPSHRRASTVHYNDAIRELATGSQESGAEKRTRVLRSAVRHWRLPVASQQFEEQLVSACRAVGEADEISRQMEQPVSFNVALTTHLGQQVGVFALSELVSYDTVEIEIVAGISCPPSALPEDSPWRAQMHLGEDAQNGALFRCKLAAFQGALVALRELFGRYADFCVFQQTQAAPVFAPVIRGRAASYLGHTSTRSIRRKASLKIQSAAELEPSLVRFVDDDSGSADDSDTESSVHIASSSSSSDDEYDERTPVVNTAGDVPARFHLLFTSFDVDGSGTINRSKLITGLHRLESSGIWGVEAKADCALRTYGHAGVLDNFGFARFVEKRMSAEFLDCFEDLMVVIPAADDARGTRVAAIAHAVATAAAAARAAHVAAADAHVVASEAAASQRVAEHVDAHEATKALVDEARAKHVELELQLKQEQSATEAHQADAKSIAAQVEAEQQRKEVLQAKARALADELAQHQKDREVEQSQEAAWRTRRADELAAQHATVERLQQELAGTRAQGEAAMEQAETAKESHEMAMRQCSALEAKHDMLQAAHAAAGREAQAERVALDLSTSESKAAADGALRQAQEQARARHAALEQQLAEKVNAAHSEAKSAIDEARRQRLQAEQDLGCQCQRADDLAKELAEQRVAAERLAEEVAAAQQHSELHADADVQAEETERQLNALSIQLDAQQAASAAHHAAYEDVVSANAEAHVEVETLKSHLAEQASSAEGHEQMVERLKARLGEQTRELERRVAQAKEAEYAQQQRLSTQERMIEGLRAQLELAVEQAQDDHEEDLEGGSGMADGTAPYTRGKMRQRRLFAERMPPALLVGCTVLVAGFGEGTVVGFKKGQLLGLGASPHTIEFSGGAGTIESPAHVETKRVVLSRHDNGRTPFVIEAMPGHSDLWAGDGEEDFGDGSDLAASPNKQMAFMCGAPPARHTRRQTHGGDNVARKISSGGGGAAAATGSASSESKSKSRHARRSTDSGVGDLSPNSDSDGRGPASGRPGSLGSSSGGSGGGNVGKR